MLASFRQNTRTKTSIRYAKENDREGERERERKERYREECAPTLNRVQIRSKILVKSPKPRNKAQRKVDYKNYDAITIMVTMITMSRNYDRKLSASILSRGKCGNYRDTGVSKNIKIALNFIQREPSLIIDMAPKQHQILMQIQCRYVFKVIKQTAEITPSNGSIWDEFSEQRQHQSIKKYQFQSSISTFLMHSLVGRSYLLFKIKNSPQSTYTEFC